MHYTVKFPNKTVSYLLNTSFEHIDELIKRDECIVITDKNVEKHHANLFKGFKKVIALEPGEASKSIENVQIATQELLDVEAHRGSYIIGVGGGMTTDFTGFLASIYMRGVKFGYVPTSLLGMVDASVGGKNGINYQLQKNLLGTFNQPEFILFDTAFLKTLPSEEWCNGFAEVIKYACLFDKEMFDELVEHDIAYYQKDDAATASVIAKCVDWKNKIVQSDELENGRRKLLNFGHTAGHAFETINNIPHGHAVALGMLVACKVSEAHGLDKQVYAQLKTLLQQYNLPVIIDTNIDKVMQVLNMDKKKNNNGIDFVLLKSIGDAYLKNVTTENIKHTLEEFTNAGDS
ncbi:MAG: 3-dehydroquinate synthase [Chitinophagales bacterium]|nr:3-dehydroquinate synthase [Chitinophagaceae bacterium]MCB9063618.1 3-dehydroquinate synthase [Chitinophagales bacterium]